MTEIAVREDSLATKMEWARSLSHSKLLPKDYQNNPGNLLYAVEYADALGIDRINAITSIHVINGKPTASADLIAGLIRKAGHRLRITSDDTLAVAQLIRADDPDFTYEARWDEGKARAAGLWGAGNWKKYPGAMLRSRAITEVARMGASDALYGVNYTSEELGADLAQPESRPVTVEEIMGEEVIESTTMADPDAIDRIAELAATIGFAPEELFAGIANTIGHPVAATNELTEDEAVAVIARLEVKAATDSPATGGQS